MHEKLRQNSKLTKRMSVLDLLRSVKIDAEWVVENKEKLKHALRISQGNGMEMRNPAYLPSDTKVLLYKLYTGEALKSRKGPKAYMED